jgi:hypothetical protein
VFDFIKKLKTVYEVPEPLSVRERALKVFSRIEGLEMMLLQSGRRGAEISEMS